MKTKKYLSVVIILTMLLVLVTATSVSAAGTKVPVCHYDKDAGVFFLINISDNAYDAHIAHGDNAPGLGVPGMPGMIFTADCSPVADVAGIWTGHSGLVGNLAYAFTMTLTQNGTDVSGIIVYAGLWNGTRTVTGTVSGNVLSIRTFDVPASPLTPYWATVSGSVLNGTSYYGTGTDSSSASVALQATKP